MKKDKRSSEEELLSLSHSFIKTFYKVQKSNCILSVSLKRWKKQGAGVCNFHVYTQILWKNLPMPNTLVQYLEVQTQFKQRLWSLQLRRSSSRTRSCELRQREKGVYNVRQGVWVEGGVDRRDVYFSHLGFACTRSHIAPIAGFWLETPQRFLSWLGSIVRSLSVRHCWLHGLTPSLLVKNMLTRAGSLGVGASGR